MSKRIGILYRENKLKIRVAATIIAIVVALLFFGVNGEKHDSIKMESETQIQTVDEVTENRSNQTGTTTEVDEKKVIICDISGQVESPGVYEMKEAARLGELIELAGGLTAEADIDAINRAATLNDGEKIYIPKLGEQHTVAHASDYISLSSKVNINSADIESLCSLKGIGPAMADRIITYRNQNGGFGSIEELKNVSGIGQKTFDKIKEHITV